jgi:hypothetical protein
MLKDDSEENYEKSLLQEKIKSKIDSIEKFKKETDAKLIKIDELI